MTKRKAINERYRMAQKFGLTHFNAKNKYCRSEDLTHFNYNMFH